VAGRDRTGIRTGRRASGGAQPRGGCESGGRWGARVVRAALVAACGKKIEWWRREGLIGEAEQATRQGREAQPGPLGHGRGRSVLWLGYMGLVWSNVFMGFISAGTLG
jgi:hypothetical protein